MATLFAAALCLATVSPRDDEPKGDVAEPKAKGHQPVAPGWFNHGYRPKPHKAKPHHRYQADGVCTCGDNPGPVEQQPEPGQE